MKAPDRFSHRNCTFILPGNLPNVPETAPRWLKEQTHGCWCASWRMTRNGMRIWRSGGWRKPEPGELRRVVGRNLLRWKAQGYA